MGNSITSRIKSKATEITTGAGAAGATITTSMSGNVAAAPCVGGACGAGCGMACIIVGVGTATGLSAYVWGKKRFTKQDVETE